MRYLDEPCFTVRADGIIEIIDVDLRAPGGILAFALNDSVTSRAPKGARNEGLSTYWIDRTQRDLEAAVSNGVTTPFASGNATHLRTDGEVVIAAFDFDPDEEESESIGVDVFMELLNEWRLQVIAHGGVSGSEAAELVAPAPPRSSGPVT